MAGIRQRFVFLIGLMSTLLFSHAVHAACRDRLQISEATLKSGVASVEFAYDGAFGIETVELQCFEPDSPGSKYGYYVNFKKKAVAGSGVFTVTGEIPDKCDKDAFRLCYCGGCYPASIY